ncbi:MAG: membrane protein insertion efficiency factor YidD [Burkholderiales bacterium]|nr:membrane protein insertion efficiency factor YidD [Burkholderiales bacterium]
MVKYILILVIKGYQILISPYLPNSCRYDPTCSSYAIIAINKYGIIRGFYLSVRRLLRCHPWGGTGSDPVP